MAGTFEIQGYCDQCFSAVKEAFRNNFESDLEVGASFAATIDGKFVVDLWGGYTDAAQTRSWERDTIANVWSTTKAMTAICALILIDRGQLDPDAPVARYWPEFAQNGKEKIPVKYVLTHQSGVAGIDEPITWETYYNWDRMIRLLEKQKPLWEPGKRGGYHAYTFGHLVGEVVRRITGKSLGAFFRDEVAVPLGADFHIGLSGENDYRVAELTPPPALKPEDPGYKLFNDPGSISEVCKKVMGNPPTDANLVLCTRDRAWRAAEIPSVNGHGNARSAARVGAAMACGGELDGVRLMGQTTIKKAIEEQDYGTDIVLGGTFRRGLGFILNSKEMPMGPNPHTFYGSGWGGSKMVVDLDAKISWSYVMNKMGNLFDPRPQRIIQALYAAL